MFDFVDQNQAKPNQNIIQKSQFHFDSIFCSNRNDDDENDYGKWKQTNKQKKN